MNSKIVTLAGAVVLLIGLFLPIFTLMGVSVNFFMPPDGIQIDGIIVIVCAVLAGLLALVNQAKWAVIPALGALAVVGLNFFKMQSQLSSGMGSLTPEQQELASQMASVNYLGWAALGLGGILILVGGIMGWMKKAPPAA